METAWLVDNGTQCLGVRDGHLVLVDYADPAALRFSRQVDAENMALVRSLMPSPLPPEDGLWIFRCTAVEHTWG